MKTTNRIFVLLTAMTAVAFTALTQPASADLEVVAVMALQPQVSMGAEVFELNADKDWLATQFAAEMKPKLSERLASEFATARRSAELADDFSEQIFDALDKRLPGEVGNLIAAADQF